MSDTTLTPKQARFCEEYVVDHNGAQAAIRSGYSAAAAKEQASRLLTKINVQDRVAELHAAHSERLETTVDSLTEGLRLAGKLAHSEGQASAAVQAVMGEAKLHGHLVDKHEEVTPPDDMGKEELATCMADLDRKLIAAMPEADLEAHVAYLQGHLADTSAELASRRHAAAGAIEGQNAAAPNGATRH